MSAEAESDYDWQAAFHEAVFSTYAGYDSDTLDRIREALPVASVERRREGEADTRDWLAYGKLADGRWFGMRAGCDYTGWD